MTFTLQGRPIGSTELARIRQLMAEPPEWSRRRLSQALCEAWNWRNAAGQIKDMASRTLLLKLEQRGHLQLPPRRRKAFNRMRPARLWHRVWDQTPLSGRLAEQQQALAQKEQAIAAQAQTIAQPQALIAQLQRMLLGAKSEKLSPEQEQPWAQSSPGSPRSSATSLCRWR